MLVGHPTLQVMLMLLEMPYMTLMLLAATVPGGGCLLGDLHSVLLLTLIAFRTVMRGNPWKIVTFPILA